MPAGIETYQWQPSSDGEAPAVRQALEGASLLVNLAGASLGSGRLTPKRKRWILESRLDATSTLVRAFAQCDNPPPVWIQASAIGYYGTRGDEILTEQSAKGTPWFLADVCQQWEDAANIVKAQHGPLVRLIIARIGLVLAKDAPAWRAMLLPIKLGVGGPLGSGDQWYAWIDADDLARGFLFLAAQPDNEGVYNFTAPDPVRQSELARRAAGVVRRPSLLRTPRFVLRALLGEAADSLLLASAKAVPARLLNAGFTFERRTIEQEIDHLLK